MANRVQLGARGSDYGLFVSVPATSSLVNGAVSNSTSVTLHAANGSIKAGQTITGSDISGSVTVDTISGTSLTLSSAQSIADDGELVFHGVDVTDCEDKDLSFNSNSARLGGIYRGGNQSQINSSTGLTWTDSDHPDLGYIPLILVVESEMGGASNLIGSPLPQYYFDASNMSTWSSTSTNLNEVSMLFDPRPYRSRIFKEHTRVASGFGIKQATNVKFFVLRIPCQYGKMTDTDLWG